MRVNVRVAARGPALIGRGLVAGSDELPSLLEVGVSAERRTSLLPAWKKA